MLDWTASLILGLVEAETHIAGLDSITNIGVGGGWNTYCWTGQQLVRMAEHSRSKRTYLIKDGAIYYIICFPDRAERKGFTFDSM